MKATGALVLDNGLMEGSHHHGRLEGLRAFLKDPKSAVGLLILTFFIAVAIVGPSIAPYGENEQDRTMSLAPPSTTHFLGTDRLGRDVFSRVIYGARISVTIGLIAVGVALVIGVPLGLVAGYSGGAVDEVLMRFVDAWVAFPSIILLLGVIAIIGPGTQNVMVAIGISSFPIYARLIRGQTLSVKQRDFVLAARSLGARSDQIMLRHLLPNTIQPIIVQGSLAVGSAVLAEASLSFLGIGVKPPTATWGVVIQDGFAVIRINPWISIAPGVAITLFVLAVNLVGDRLRDVMDPRLRGTR
jgi:peptide/nickel transport system permease protein